MLNALSSLMDQLGLENREGRGLPGATRGRGPNGDETDLRKSKRSSENNQDGGGIASAGMDCEIARTVSNRNLVLRDSQKMMSGWRSRDKGAGSRRISQDEDLDTFRQS